MANRVDNFNLYLDGEVWHFTKDDFGDNMEQFIARMIANTRGRGEDLQLLVHVSEPAFYVRSCKAVNDGPLGDEVGQERLRDKGSSEN